MIEIETTKESVLFLELEDHQNRIIVKLKAEERRSLEAARGDKIGAWNIRDKFFERVKKRTGQEDINKLLEIEIDWNVAKTFVTLR